MDRSTAEALRILDEARRTIRLDTPAVRLSPEYLRAVAKAETIAGGAAGRDKTWVVSLLRRSRLLKARAKRVR